MRKVLHGFRKNGSKSSRGAGLSPAKSGEGELGAAENGAKSKPSSAPTRVEEGLQNGGGASLAAPGGADTVRGGDGTTGVMSGRVTSVPATAVPQADGQQMSNALDQQSIPQDGGPSGIGEASTGIRAESATVLVDFDGLWDEAYDSLKSGRTKTLVERYEKVVGSEIARVNRQKAKGKQADGAGSSDTEVLPEQVSQTSRDLRRKQMKSLVQARQDVSEAGSTIKGIAAGAETVVSALKDKIASALEAYPPAGLAFAGLSLLLNTAFVSIQASRANITGLQYVVTRLTWYGTLTRLLLRNNWKSDRKEDFASVRDNMRDRLLDLFKELIKYEMKSVCSYYGWNRAVTYLGDQADLNDWKGDVDDIKASEGRLLQDVAVYNKQLSLDLQNQQTQSSEEMRGLLEQLVKLQTDHELREKQREERALKQEDESTKKQVNELIQAFSVKGLHYTAFKDDLNRRAEPGTCIWFRTHENYKDWQTSSCGLLLVTAPPGCGKSVLMRTLVDEAEVPRESSRVVCHFFFKESNLQDRPEWALCAVLHQLFKKRRHLVLEFKDVILDEAKEALQGDRDKLWSIFADAITMLDDVDVVCFLDALDECKEEGREWLVAKLANLVERRQPRHLKLLITSRPYEKILQLFDAFQTHFIELETKDREIAQISREIDTVIDRKLEGLAHRRRQPPSTNVVESLRKALKATQNRTYLWVRLVFEVLEKVWLNSEDDWMEPIQCLPASVDEAYEKLLQGIPAKHTRVIQHLLSIILVAFRSLFVEELRLAYTEYLSLESTAYKFPSSSEMIFADWLTNTCGFFVHIFEGKVFFIHQTVREFLSDPSSTEHELNSATWKQSIVSSSAHRILAEASIAYLSKADFFNINFVKVSYPFPRPDYRAAGFSIDSLKIVANYFDRFKFLGYATQYWVEHFQNAQTLDIEEDLTTENFYGADKLAEFELSLQDIRPSLRMQYFDLFHKPNFCTLAWWHDDFGGSHGLYPKSLGWGRSTDFIMGVECRHYRLLLKGAEEGQDLAVREQERRTALHIACEEDHLLLARWLLFFGASLKELHYSTSGLPIQKCKSNLMISLIVLAGGDINEKDRNGDTALHVVCKRPKLNRQLASILIGHGADATRVNAESHTALHGCDDPDVIRELAVAGAPLNAQDAHGDTALHMACRQGRDGSAAAQQLIKLGADVTKRNNVAQTPLKALLWHLNSGIMDTAELLPLIGLLAKIPVQKDLSRILQLFPRHPPAAFLSWAVLVELLCDLVRQCGYPIRLKRHDLLHTPLSLDLRAVFLKPLYEYIDWAEVDCTVLDIKGHSLLRAACDMDLDLPFKTQQVIIKELLSHDFDPTLSHDGNPSVLAYLLSSTDKHFHLTAPMILQLTAGIKEPSQLTLDGKAPMLFLLDIQLGMASSDDPGLSRLQYIVETMLRGGFPGGKGVDLEGRNALHYLTGFIASGRPGRSRPILLRNRDVDYLVRRRDIALVEAVSRLMDIFIGYGTHPRARDKTGKTPLQLLVSEGWHEGYELVFYSLSQRGKESSEQDEDGNTWLHELCSDFELFLDGFPDAVRAVLHYGLDPNITNSKGETPLRLLCWRAVKIVLTDSLRRDKFLAEYLDCLVSHGADPNVADSSGETAMDMVLRFQNSPRALLLAQALLRGGADPERPGKDGQTAAEAVAAMQRRADEEAERAGGPFSDL